VGWVSASRLHYAAYYIQRAYNEDDKDEMIRRYPNLVESVIEFKRFSHQLQHEMLKLPGECQETEKERTTCVAKSYHIRYCEEDDYYYCTRDDQAVEQRKALLRLMEMKPNFHF